MREEILHKLSNMKAQDLKDQLIRFSKEATLHDIKALQKIIDRKPGTEDTIKFGDAIVPKEYFYSIQRSGILEHAFDIIDAASKRYPITTLDILIFLKAKKISHKFKTQVGKLLTVAGFEKISLHRPGQTPTKAWVPVTKHIHDEYRAEYFFSLLKDYVKIADTKALDDLI